MIALLRPPTQRSWLTLSFASTLYIRPIVDMLVAEVPYAWQAEIRLGLQEALINAVDHGNDLDPTKQVFVRYAVHAPMYEWIIRDQGLGFVRPPGAEGHPCLHAECGRGTFILKQVFDHIAWNEQGNELHLCKAIGQSLPKII